MRGAVGEILAVLVLVRDGGVPVGGGGGGGRPREGGGGGGGGGRGGGRRPARRPGGGGDGRGGAAEDPLARHHAQGIAFGQPARQQVLDGPGEGGRRDQRLAGPRHRSGCGRHHQGDAAKRDERHGQHHPRREMLA